MCVCPCVYVSTVISSLANMGDFNATADLIQMRYLELGCDGHNSLHC